MSSFSDIAVQKLTIMNIIKNQLLVSSLHKTTVDNHGVVDISWVSYAGVVGTFHI